MIIGLVGKAKSGKDTVGDYLVKEFAFKKVAFADDLKALCKDMFNLTDEQVFTQEGKAAIDPRYNITPREILQKVGTDWFRSVYPNIWVERLVKHLRDNKPYNHYVVTDLRFPNEIQAIMDVGGLVVKLVRLDGGEIGVGASHASETALDSIHEGIFTVVLRAASGDLDTLYAGIKTVFMYNRDKLILKPRPTLKVVATND